MSDPTSPAGWGIQLAKLWLSARQPFPVDVKQIALEVTKTRYSDPIGLVRGHGIPGIDGMLSKRKTKGDWCISYDESVPIAGRINFTLGHELGHYLMHRNLRDDFRCGQRDMLDYHSAASRKLEAEANKFASYLLMPANDFREQIDGQAITLDLLGHCAERYGASFTATALKWLEITDQAAILVVARDDFICWSYPSELARKRGTYLPPGTPVPDSALERLHDTERSLRRNALVRVPAGVWHPHMEADESVILSDQFELAIFLVQFPFAKATDYEDEPEQDSFTFLSDRAKGLNWKK